MLALNLSLIAEHCTMALTNVTPNIAIKFVRRGHKMEHGGRQFDVPDLQD